MPNITRGGSTAGLMMYLAGGGKRNEHKDQHVIAGDTVLAAQFAGATLDNDTALDIASHLDFPMRVYGTTVTAPVKRWDPEAEQNVKIGDKPAHMWHASLSIKAEEGQLSDEQWSNIARDFVRDMGFDDDTDTAPCRWVAVRHGESSAGNDHVHIAVNLVREDGTKARVHNDYKRAQQITNTLEKKYGLQVLASREQEREAPRGAKPAEVDRVAAGKTLAPERDELRRRLRSAAVAATGERDFIERAREARVLIRPRYEKGSTSKVVGYSAALVPPRNDDGSRGTAVWFGGAKLDSALGLGQLRNRWNSTEADESAAVDVWTARGNAARNHEYDVPKQGRPTRLPWETVQRLNAHGQNVVPDRTAGFNRHAAIDMSGAFAQASIYFERGEHGPFAQASDVFARVGARDRFTNQDPGRVKEQNSALAANAAYTARLVQRATGRDSITGWTAVFRQMSRVGKLIVQERQLAGDTAAVVAVQAAMANAMRAADEVTAQQAPAAPTTGGPAAAPMPTRRTPEQGAGGRETGAER
ncbi:relaxase/mobilization nuclease domain-containing protein [Curtobacterium sp. MCBD17_026]|uniref:relaxase/mobilization nuclease domain-containing protein n=1 Tax=Curtobacterium sp. MCBD17_026 TaxID=2175621 RepID=UPI0024DF85DC|nr:relaxase/mobilization nuclease domain-containing protein [Curtobacterium sp. MCBD17_026]WIB72600.1 relaxase/mobilization nuclease domain-containing protein [Curtobacterium sp. MCBD17_026]